MAAPGFIPLFDPQIDASVVDRVTETLRSGWISEGRLVRQFEAQFCGRFGLPSALALNSGTAALHLAVLGSGVGPGDEVITTTQTFVATAMSIMHAGAAPIFADIQPGGPNIDPQDIAHRVTPRTKAVLVVHYGGYPCDMEEIGAVADRHGLAVIEDAAHALGAEYRGRPVGSLGRFAAFSFQAIKQLTTGDGGMLVCRDPEDHQLAYRRRWFGIDRANRRPSDTGQPEWDITEVGYKYHMNDLAAAMGLAQLELFANAHAQRRALNARYRTALSEVPGLTLLEEQPDRVSASWLFTVRVERRLEFVRAVKSRGVEAAVWHRRIDRNGLFGGLRDDLPNQAQFDETQVSLPLRPSLTEEMVERVLTAVRAGW